MDSSEDFKWFTRIKVKVEKWIEFVGMAGIYGKKDLIFLPCLLPRHHQYHKMMIIKNLRHVTEHQKKGGMRRKGERERGWILLYAVTRTMKMLFYIITKLSVFVFLHLPEFLMLFVIIIVTYKHSFGYFHLNWSFDYTSANCFFRGASRTSWPSYNTINLFCNY